MNRTFNNFGFSDKEWSQLLLDKAANICVWKHAGQRDKTGCAYFLHPMRVALKCQTDDQKIVALLHDVLEDTDYSIDNLRSESFPEHIIEAIVNLTRRSDESYEDFIARAKKNPLAKVVKIHDIEDNLDALRLDSFSPEMSALFTKYIAARQFLLADDDVDVDVTTHDDSQVKEDGLAKFSTSSESCEEYSSDEDDEAPQDDNEEQSYGKYEVKRIVLSREQSCRDQRDRINKRLANYRPLGKTEYMQNKIQVRMPDRSVICESATYHSFIKVLEYIGFEKVSALNLRYKKCPIVTKSPFGDLYKQANAFWYVLAKWPTMIAAQYINEIANELDLCIECDVVPR